MELAQRLRAPTFTDRTSRHRLAGLVFSVLAMLILTLGVGPEHRPRGCGYARLRTER